MWYGLGTTAEKFVVIRVVVVVGDRGGGRSGG